MEIESVILALNRIKTVAYSGSLLVVFYLFCGVAFSKDETRCAYDSSLTNDRRELCAAVIWGVNGRN